MVFLRPEADTANTGEFENFDVPANLVAVVKDNIITDFQELLPPGVPQAQIDLQLNMARACVDLARLQLDQVDMATDPLEWWGTHFAIIHRVVKMLFQIPASSAENERSFSSASFYILSERRTQWDLDNFRREHRIRRAICAGSTPQQRLQRSNALMERFAQVLLDREANAAQ